MKVQIRKSFLLAVVLSAMTAHGQATPTAAPPETAGFNATPNAGDLTYTLGASESLLFGYNGDSVASSTNISGTAAYVSQSERYPFSTIYSGGYLFGDGGGQISGSYQNFGISQSIINRNSSFVFGDLVSYLPSSPVFTLSGVAGVGDVGSVPIGLGGAPTDSILTPAGRRITNTASGQGMVQLTGATSLNGFGSYTLQRFIDDVGIDNNDLGVGGSVMHRLSPLTTVGAGYSLSRFSYTDSNFLIDTHSFNLIYNHTFSRTITFDGSIGPQWTVGSDSSIVPSSVNLAADLELFYTARTTKYLLSYLRGSNTGGGVFAGTFANNVNFTAQRNFSRNWTGSASLDYGHASSLTQCSAQTSQADCALASQLPIGNGVGVTVNTFYAGLQATRALGRSFSAFGSYTLEKQDISGGSAANAFSGMFHVLGFGITYAPRPIRLHHQ